MLLQARNSKEGMRRFASDEGGSCLADGCLLLCLLLSLSYAYVFVVLLPLKKASVLMD